MRIAATSEPRLSVWPGSASSSRRTALLLGQAALVLLIHPDAASTRSSCSLPSWAPVPLVLLATVATVVASRAVISGSYSVAKQAMQLSYPAAAAGRHTSLVEGQIYVPVVNWFLAAGVVALVLAFQTSNALSNAYGVAVTGTFILNTVLFLVVARAIWHPPAWKLAPPSGRSSCLSRLSSSAPTWPRSSRAPGSRWRPGRSLVRS